MTEAPSLERIEETKRQIIKKLEDEADLAFATALTRVLGQGDLIMLNALGIDGRQKMLDIFIERCEHMKKEISNEF